MYPFLSGFKFLSLPHPSLSASGSRRALLWLEPSVIKYILSHTLICPSLPVSSDTVKYTNVNKYNKITRCRLTTGAYREFLELLFAKQMCLAKRCHQIMIAKVAVERRSSFAKR